jgi:2-methylcitrate dehydratase PrpD
MSSGLKENFGTMTKSLHAGLAASNAIKAGLLAKGGFTSAGEILEGPLGFCKVMCSGAEAGKIIQNLGKPWEIEVPGITRKKYPCCARTHAAIDAVLKIVKQNEIDHRDLEEITCSTDEMAFKVLVHPSPTSELEAKFSMPFCLSIAFLEKDVFIQHFNQKLLQNKTVADVMAKVKHIADRSISDQGYENRWISKVKIKLKNGESYFELVKRPKGDPINPFTFDELADKFLRCAHGVLDPKVGESILRKIKDLENQEDIMRMIEELSKGIITQ